MWPIEIETAFQANLAKLLQIYGSDLNAMAN
jgi:hypothetical protein